MDGGGSPRCLRLGVRDGGGSSDTCVDWVVGTDSISSCTLMVGMDGRSASVVLVVVSDVSNSECRAPRLFGSRIEGLPAILLLCRNDCLPVPFHHSILMLPIWGAGFNLDTCFGEDIFDFASN